MIDRHMKTLVFNDVSFRTIGLELSRILIAVVHKDIPKTGEDWQWDVLDIQTSRRRRRHRRATKYNIYE
jgi:hypothetical protein